MNNVYLVSIIVPVYNVEKYIDKCVKSILTQTYSNVEILLIDDGSTDKSGDICDIYAKEDSRIKVFHKKNGGLASARNLGLINSTGNYIMFVDSDDWIENITVEYLLNLTKEHDLDVLVFGNYEDYPLENYSKCCRMKENVFQTGMLNQGVIFDLYREGLLNTVWNKFYSRRSLISCNTIILFDEKTEPAEDILFNSKVLNGKINVGVTTELFYHYVKDEKVSLVTRYTKNIIELSDRRSQAFEKIFEAYGLTDVLSRKWLDAEYVNGKMDCILNCYRAGADLNVKERTKVFEKVLKNEKFIECRANMDSDHLNGYIKLFRYVSFLPVVCVRIVYDLLMVIRQHSRFYYRIRSRMLKNGK